MIEPSKIFQKGFSDGKRGRPRSKNPYTQMSLSYDEWNKGWFQGQDLFLNGETKGETKKEKSRVI